MSKINPVLRVSIVCRPSSVKVKKRMYAVFLRKNYPKGREYHPLYAPSFDRIVRAMEPCDHVRTYFMSMSRWRHPPAMFATWRLHD